MSVLTKYRGLPALDALRREADELFSQFFPSILDDDAREEAVAMWRPRMDLTEVDGAYRVQVDLPGMKKEDVVVDVSDHRLTIRGERKYETKEEKENFIRRERSYGNFFRSFALPSSVNEEDITAEFKDGVLTINIPKIEEAKSRSIDIK